jgi:hypothetical protein
MRPLSWHPPIDPSTAEQAIIQRIRRAKLFVFLRQHRHELFDDAFQAELATLYHESALGQPPIPPQHNWQWQRFCRPMLAFPTMRSSKR